MENKKSAIVIDNAFLYAGTENICNFMTECISKNSNIDILSVKGTGKPFYSFSGVNQILTFNDSKHPVFDIVKKIKKEQYNSVFIISMGRLSFEFMLCLMFFKKNSFTKLIACEHVSFQSFNFLIKKMKLWALKKYDKVVVLTELDKNYFLSKKINAIKILNPINYRNHIKNKKFRKALAIGRLSRQKGFDILLSIWKDFINNNPGWVLDIAGDGECLEELKLQCQKLNISDSVSFLGKIQDVSSLYKYSDMFLMTSRYEGLPLVLLEAKSWSLPCIAFDCPTGPREIIVDNKDGFLIEMSDYYSYLEKMNKLANDFDLLREFSYNTKLTYKKFSNDAICSQWLELI